MTCPRCNSDNLKVQRSVKTDFEDFNLRYVSCRDCYLSFQTREFITIVYHYDVEKNKKVTLTAESYKKVYNYVK